jgi:hypothetical protein
MTAQPYRFTAPGSRDPILHELSPLRLSDQLVTLLLSVRCDDGGIWRARLRFIDPDERVRETAEIFCDPSEAELWQSVNGLPEHHLRALYLSLA